MNEFEKEKIGRMFATRLKWRLIRIIIGDRIGHFFGAIICPIASLIPKGEFANVTFWKSRNKKYLYFCMSEDHIKEEKPFIKTFPEAVRISQIEFDLLIFFYPERSVVEVGDAAIIDDDDDDEGIYDINDYPDDMTKKQIP